MNGYSDRINHALAFAAKHHDQRVRRGVRPPYSTQPANVGIILTRYGYDDDTVTAGILLEVVEDYGREASSPELLQTRIGEKFGARALEIALMVAERRSDDHGLELSADERRDDVLRRLGSASTEGHVIAAADALHNAGTLLADLRRTVDVNAVWTRVPGGRVRTLETYQRFQERLDDCGFRAPILDELRETVSALAGIPG